jgi:hypothetical protein
MGEGEDSGVLAADDDADEDADARVRVCEGEETEEVAVLEVGSDLSGITVVRIGLT